MSDTNSEGKNIVTSVEYRLWGILRQNGWWNTYLDSPLTQSTGVDEVTKIPIPDNTYFYEANPHPFVFIDPFNEVTASGFAVYDDGIPLSPSGYSIDYMNARITLNLPPSGAVTADLNIFEVGVRSGYPDDHELELMDLPVVAFQPQTDDGEPFFIGTALQLNRRYFNIYIMAKNRGQQVDLMNDLRKFIRYIPYVDYSDHEPLNENKQLDLEFSYADQLESQMFVLGGIRGTYLEPRPGGSDKEKFRALIAFEIEKVG